MDAIKHFLDTTHNKFGHRLRATIQRKGFTKESFAEAMGVSRATLYNWFARDEPPPSRQARARMVQLLAEPEAYLMRGVEPSKIVGHLNLGGLAGAAVEEPRGKHEAVASRIPQQRLPSTRADCEAYVQQLFNRVEVSDNPNAFPFIYERLIREFPLAEWPLDPPVP